MPRDTFHPPPFLVAVRLLSHHHPRHIFQNMTSVLSIKRRLHSSLSPSLPLRLTPRNARRLVGRRASLVVVRWLSYCRRWVGSWVEKRERNERERERKRERGRSIAFQNDREKDFSPRRAAPVGALCEKSPPIRPNLVVAPTGAARRRLGFAFALQTPLQFRFPLLSGIPDNGGVGSCVRVPPTGEIGTPTPAPPSALQ